MSFFLGLDLSTTGAKALVIDRQGIVISSAVMPITISMPRPLWSEQDPHEWWQAAAGSISQALGQAHIPGEQVAAVGLTGQMHGLVLLNKEGEVLRPAILWNDQRCEVECQEIRDRMGRLRLIEITGNDALTGFTAPKILWVQKHEPDIYARTRHILLPKDYIRYKLTERFAMDKADGSGTILFDLKQRDWSVERLENWNTGCCRGRRPGSGRRRHRCSSGRYSCVDSGYLRCSLRSQRIALNRATRKTPFLLSCSAQLLASYGRDAECRRQSPMVS